MPRRLRLVHFQPEIERYLRRRRKDRRERESFSALDLSEVEMAEGWNSHPDFSWNNNDGRAPNRSQFGCGAGFSNNQFPYQQALTVPAQEDMNQLLHSMMTLMTEQRNSNANQFTALANLIQQNSSKTGARFNALEQRMEQWETKAESINSYVTQLSNNMIENQERSSGTIPSNTIINIPEEVYTEEIEVEAVPQIREKEIRSESVVEDNLLNEEKSTAKEQGTTPRSSTEKAEKAKSSEHGAPSKEDTSLILEQPFLRTASTMINMTGGKIPLEVGDQQVSFHMYEAMKHPHEDYSLLSVNMLDVVVDDAYAEFEQNMNPLTCDPFGGTFDVDVSGVHLRTGVGTELHKSQAAEMILGYQLDVRPELKDPP